MFVREAGINFFQEIETANHETGGNQQNECGRHFNYYQQAPQPLSTARASACFFQRLMHVNFAGLNSRNQAKQNPGEKRDTDRESEHGPIETNLTRSWNRVRTDIQNQLDSPARQ